jgi:hypothetical protein
MANANVAAPRLPPAPAAYDQVWVNNFLQVLRIYFNQLDNNGPLNASSSGVGTTKVVSGLSFIHPDPAQPNSFVTSLPTQADLANLRSGSIYYDTSANNVLKVKP